MPVYLKIRFWGAYNILICPSFEEIRAKYVPPPHVPTFIFCGQNKCVASSHHIAHWKILNLSSLFLLILLIIICPLLIYSIIIFYFLFSGKPKFTCFSFQNQYFVVDFRLSIIWYASSKQILYEDKIAQIEYCVVWQSTTSRNQA